MNKIAEDCEDCQRLLKQIGKHDVYDCQYCSHLVKKGEWCTCTKGQFEQGVYDELRVVLLKTKQVHISLYDFIQIQSPEAMIEYLKNDPTNVELEYRLIFSGCVYDGSSDGALAFVRSNKLEDYVEFMECSWTYEWQEIETIKAVEDKIKWIDKQ